MSACHDRPGPEPRGDELAEALRALRIQVEGLATSAGRVAPCLTGRRRRTVVEGVKSLAGLVSRLCEALIREGPPAPRG
jgi:hypothetical protein